MSDVEVRGMRVAYDANEVVHDADLYIPAGSITALVGESGCGKSSTALAIARLLPNSATTSGTIRIGDVDLSELHGKALMSQRGSLVGYIPQSTSSSLNPVRRVGTHLCELFHLRLGLNRSDSQQRAVEALTEVEISDPERVMRLFQHQLSGGMRQRVSIAMALALAPKLLIADEPTTALDTTVQGEILALVSRLSETRGTTVLWITHDLGVVSAIATQVVVMYAGWVVERAETRTMFDSPQHPYTQGLLASFASGRDGAPFSRFITADGQPPSDHMLAGCAFHPRCMHAVDQCRTQTPTSVVIGHQRTVMCRLIEAAP